MGHPCFDLGNLSVNNDFDDADDERLLRAYHGEPPSDARRAELALMRILSDAREAAWGVVQAEVSELDFDFDRYARTHFERLRAAVEQPQLEEWLAAARGGRGGGARWPGRVSSPTARAWSSSAAASAAPRSPTTSPSSASATSCCSTATSSPAAPPSTPPGSSANSDRASR